MEKKWSLVFKMLISLVTLFTPSKQSTNDRPLFQRISKLPESPDRYTCKHYGPANHGSSRYGNGNNLPTKLDHYQRLNYKCSNHQPRETPDTIDTSITKWRGTYKIQNNLPVHKASSLALTMLLEHNNYPHIITHFFVRQALTWTVGSYTFHARHKIHWERISLP